MNFIVDVRRVPSGGRFDPLTSTTIALVLGLDENRFEFSRALLWHQRQKKNIEYVLSHELGTSNIAAHKLEDINTQIREKRLEVS